MSVSFCACVSRAHAAGDWGTEQRVIVVHAIHWRGYSKLRTCLRRCEVVIDYIMKWLCVSKAQKHLGQKEVKSSAKASATR